MYAYCPTINQQKCGFPGGTASKEMVLRATTDVSTVFVDDLRYLKQGFNRDLMIGIGSEDARYDSCYYEVSLDPDILPEFNPKTIKVQITDKSQSTNAYIYEGTSRKEATKSLKIGNQQVQVGETF